VIAEEVAIVEEEDTAIIGTEIEVAIATDLEEEEATTVVVEVEVVVEVVDMEEEEATDEEITGPGRVNEMEVEAAATTARVGSVCV